MNLTLHDWQTLIKIVSGLYRSIRYIAYALLS